MHELPEANQMSIWEEFLIEARVRGALGRKKDRET